MFRHIKITHWLHHINPWLNPQVRSQQCFLSLSLLTFPLLWRYPTISHYISHNVSTYPTISHYIPLYPTISHYISLYPTISHSHYLTISHYINILAWILLASQTEKTMWKKPTISRSFSWVFPHRCHVHPRVHTWLCSRGSNNIYT